MTDSAQMVSAGREYSNAPDDEAIVSVEVPVFKGRFLAACIRSVLAQTSSRWRLSLAWDGGDAYSRRLLERVAAWRDPRITVAFKENEGIAPTYRFLTEHSSGRWILPLDDDDMLAPRAVERLIQEAEKRPWASVWRGRRKCIDERGTLLEGHDVFPFGPRRFEHGMVSDVWNFTQPYLIRRSAYARTSGWTGFPDFRGAGEDGALSLELEEVAPIVLVDEVLYFYRMSPIRASLGFTLDDAHELWRRLTDAAIRRTGLAVRRTNEVPPYRFARLPQPMLTLADVDFVLPNATGLDGSVEEWRAQLYGLGVSADAILVHEGPISRAWARGTMDARRHLVALIHPAAVPPSADVLHRLIDTLADESLDVLAPVNVSPTGEELVARATVDAEGHLCPVGPVEPAAKVRRRGWLGPALLIARRGALRAVSGPDETLEPELAMLDLCVRLGRRDLVCAEVGTERVTLRTPLELSRFQAHGDRWADAAAV